MKSPGNTPARFSEPAFRRYENVIAAICHKWPVPVSLDITTLPLSPETITCRLRDAMSGFVKFSYPSDIVDRQKFLSIYDEVTVSRNVEENAVVIGPRSAVRRGALISPMHSTSPQHKNDCYGLTNPRKDIFFAFCLLLSNRLLSKPLLVQFMDPQLLLEAQQTYDIDASLQDDGSTLII